MAQFPGLSLPPSGGNQKAAVTQYVGPVKISVEYSSPKVHSPAGEDRRGKIWGKLVPYGMVNLGFGTAKESPWRAGANENTVFATSHAIQVEGKPLAAGRYGFHISPSESEWTLIFSRNAESWGSFFYDPAEDALRVTVKPVKHEYREWLTYEFTERKADETYLQMSWEDLAVGFRIRVEAVDDVHVSTIDKELRNMPGFSWQGFLTASQYAAGTKHLDKALEWAEAAISRPFVGQPNFATLSNKAAVLDKMNRSDEARQVMEKALPSATPQQIHQYGRRLLSEGKKKQALEVFELNAKRNGDAWPIHVGLARAHMANGDTAKALEHARKALAQAPDEMNRKNLDAMVKALAEGKPFNN